MHKKQIERNISYYISSEVIDAISNSVQLGNYKQAIAISSNNWWIIRVQNYKSVISQLISILIEENMLEEVFSMLDKFNEFKKENKSYHILGSPRIFLDENEFFHLISNGKFHIVDRIILSQSNKTNIIDFLKFYIMSFNSKDTSEEYVFSLARYLNNQEESELLLGYLLTIFLYSENKHTLPLIRYIKKLNKDAYLSFAKGKQWLTNFL
jgi:hypothetical protein